MRTVTTMISMKPGTSGKKGGNTQKAYNADYKTKCAMIAHFVFCPIKTHPKSILKRSKIYPVKGVDMIRKYGIVKV